MLPAPSTSPAAVLPNLAFPGPGCPETLSEPQQQLDAGGHSGLNLVQA